MNDHIPDITKMINDTPRTDAEAFYPHDSKEKVCDADFARQLERELNAANSKIELLMSANADVARIAGERDAAEKRIRLLIAERDTARLQADQKCSLREEFRELLGTDDIEVGVAVVREMKNRIKRLEGHIEGLESVGDSLFNGVTRIEAEQRWRKAKEAKL